MEAAALSRLECLKCSNHCDDPTQGLMGNSRWQKPSNKVILWVLVRYQLMDPLSHVIHQEGSRWALQGAHWRANLSVWLTKVREGSVVWLVYSCALPHFMNLFAQILMFFSPRDQKRKRQTCKHQLIESAGSPEALCSCPCIRPSWRVSRSLAHVALEARAGCGFDSLWIHLWSV